jgi:phi13 family phage major tail protein
MPNPIIGEYIDALNLYYALVTADDAAAYTAGTPVFLAPLASIASETEYANEPRYYGGKVYFYSESEGPTKLTFQIPGLDAQKKATLLGKKYIAGSTKRFADSGKAKAPWLAIGYGSKVADQDGGDHLVVNWFLKGKFAPPKVEAATRTTELDPKVTELEFTAVPTEHEFTVDGEGMPLKCWGADAALDPSITESTWFEAVQHPNMPTITVNTQPADDEVTVGAIAGSVSVTADASSGTMTYQWYRAAESDSYDNAVPIGGATASDYALPGDLTAGEHYYFCRISIADAGVTMFTDIATITAVSI